MCRSRFLLCLQCQLTAPRPPTAASSCCSSSTYIHLPFVSLSHQLAVGFLLSLICHVFAPPVTVITRRVLLCINVPQHTEAPARRSINMFLSVCECCLSTVYVCVCVCDFCSVLVHFQTLDLLFHFPPRASFFFFHFSCADPQPAALLRW